MSRASVIRKIRIRNFKSIQDETLEFANPLFLVGRNGSGKSNFVDALAFVADCMAMPLQTAYERQVPAFNAFVMSHARQFPEVPWTPPLEIVLELEDDTTGLRGHYAFALSPSDPMLGSLDVAHEECRLINNTGEAISFRRDMHSFESSLDGFKFAVTSGALALPILGGVPEFLLVLQCLAAMRVYAIDPARVREEHFLSNGFLQRDGSNAGSVLFRLQLHEDEDDSRTSQLLQAILPVSTIVRSVPEPNNRVKLFFSQRLRHEGDRIAFEARDVSDGTLSTLGLIVALTQDPLPSLIAIEEPELNLHPGALALISDLIENGASRTQIIITTHSPELLDAKWIQPENVRVVEWTDEGTRILALGERPVRVLQEHLMTSGELLRSNALDAAAMPRNGTGENAIVFDEVSA